MDNRESKTPEEELQHLKEVSQPEDFDHPEPDANQPEAKQSSRGWQRVLPIVIVVLGVLVAGLLMFSGAE
jgi:hypothetical protein